MRTEAELTRLLFPLYLSGWTHLLGLHVPVAFPLRIELEQGVSLETRGPEDVLARLEPAMGGRYNPTHFVKVCGEKYIDAVRQRRVLPSLELTVGEWETVGSGLTRRLILALILADYLFVACPSWRYWVEIRPDYWEAGGGSDSSHIENISEEHRLEWEQDVFQEWFERLEPFYCAFKPCENRLAVALHAFWVALSSGRDDQRIPGLMVACEALLSTDKAELTHQVSERAAFLLEQDPSRRLALYKTMKRQYARRSAFVHGAPSSKQHRAPTAHGSPKWTASESYDLVWIVTRLLRLALSIDTYRQALDAKDQSHLNTYLQGLVFGVLQPPEPPPIAPGTRSEERV